MNRIDKEILIKLYKLGKRFSSPGWGIGFYPLINKLLLPYLRQSYIKFDENRIYLDEKDSLNLSVNRIHEPFETELVKRLVKNGDVVLDIGANIGYYTLIFAKLVGERGEVFAFEPDPTNFALLQKNIKANKYNNVSLERIAISNKSEKTKLYLSNLHSGDHQIYKSSDDRRFININAVRLDEYFREYTNKISLIKMDIEGAEGGAILGMKNLLKKNKEIKIVMEFWPFGMRTFGTEPKDCLNRLLQLGFRLYNINEQEKKIEKITINELLKSVDINKRNQTNLFCSRSKL